MLPDERLLQWRRKGEGGNIHEQSMNHIPLLKAGHTHSDQCLDSSAALRVARKSGMINVHWSGSEICYQELCRL